MAWEKSIIVSYEEAFKRELLSFHECIVEGCTPLTSGIEFVGGLMLLVGLLTRFAAVPLMIVMVVAIVSAKLGDIDSLVTLLGFEEVSYFVMFAWLAIAGPGPVSLDHFILQAADRDPVDHGA